MNFHIPGPRIGAIDAPHARPVRHSDCAWYGWLPTPVSAPTCYGCLTACPGFDLNAAAYSDARRGEFSFDYGSRADRRAVRADAGAAYPAGMLRAAVLVIRWADGAVHRQAAADGADGHLRRANHRRRTGTGIAAGRAAQPRRSLPCLSQCRRRNDGRAVQQRSAVDYPERRAARVLFTAE